MKLRFTAFSISSMDMNTVMIFRRNRKPATPRANRIALSVRNHEMGTSAISIHLLSCQNDCAQNCNQDKDGGHFKRKKVSGEQRHAHIVRRAPGICNGSGMRRQTLESTEVYCAGRKHALHDPAHRD